MNIGTVAEEVDKPYMIRFEPYHIVKVPEKLGEDLIKKSNYVRVTKKIEKKLKRQREKAKKK